jgi:hypothetical protein
VKVFNVSRIQTAFGIFRISGIWSNHNIADINIHSIELMGTDGWVLLDQSSINVITLMSNITPTLQTHLLAKGL